MSGNIVPQKMYKNSTGRRLRDFLVKLNEAPVPDHPPVQPQVPSVSESLAERMFLEESVKFLEC